MTTHGSIGPASQAFTRRLANLLRHHRRVSKQRLRTLARASDGRFTVADLRRFEDGRLPASAIDAAELAALYGADLEAILPARLPLKVDPTGILEAAGVTVGFSPEDPDSILVAYLRLVRRLRGEQREPTVALRRDDIEVLAAALDEPGTSIVDRLAILMDLTRSQRRAMATLFVTGAVVIGLSATATAGITAIGAGDGTSDPAGTDPPAAVSVIDVPTPDSSGMASGLDGLALGFGDPGDPEPAGPTGEGDEPGEGDDDGGTIVEAWKVVRGIADVGDDGSVSFEGSQGERRVMAAGTPMVNGTITVETGEMTGPGYGVWVRSRFDDNGRVIHGWTVQVDPGLGGALVVRRWAHDREAAPVARTNVSIDELLRAQTLVIEVTGERLDVTLGDHRIAVEDLSEAAAKLGGTWVGEDGDTVGLRAWRSTEVVVHSVTVETADESDPSDPAPVRRDPPAAPVHPGALEPLTDLDR